MKYRSVFDIIGPIMIGPSSSHTAGAVRIGRVARKIFGTQPDKIKIHLYGSFVETYKGHATDIAVIGGILDFETYDSRIRDSIAIARDLGIDVEFIMEEAVPNHPNTMNVVLGKNEHYIEVEGISIGGGSITITKLNGFDLRLSGDYPTLLIIHNDKYGAISNITQILTKYRINIGHMEVSRKEKGRSALMVIETDQFVEEEIIEQMSNCENIIKVILLNDKA